MSMLIRNARVLDEKQDRLAAVLIEGAVIADIISDDPLPKAQIEIDAGGMVLTSAFIDMHVHLRDPGYPEKENLESGCMAAAAGGFGSLVCMANTAPVLDSADTARALHERSQKLGLCEVFPVLSLSRGMNGTDTSHLAALNQDICRKAGIRMLSEDGKDIEDLAVFREACSQARRLGLAVSCHCDAGGDEAARAKQEGQDRSIWSRMEENNATRRVLELARETGAHIHVAHVSTKEALKMIQDQKKELGISCEATPHHCALEEKTAEKLGKESFGRVNPPLRAKEDRLALIQALSEGLVDTIATDHAPHTRKDKEAGAPGFTGLETAFAVCNRVLVASGQMDLKKLSSLMSANPARLLGLKDRGRVQKGFRADLVLLDPDERYFFDPALSRSRSRNSPYSDMLLQGRVLMSIHGGNIVYQSDHYS